MTKQIDLLPIIPKSLYSGSSQKNARIHFDNQYIYLSFMAEIYNNASKEFSYTFPRYVLKTEEMFEVVGLLQAEMGKTQNGCLTFVNSEPKIMNKIFRWFEKEMEIKRGGWKWYLKLNLKKPKDKEYKTFIEYKCLTYWKEKCLLDDKNSYPHKVGYIKKTKREKLKDNYYGSLVIDYKRTIFSQVIKKFVENTTEYIINYDEKFIRAYMRGIIAGEGCVQNDSKTGHYSVHISASKQEEREIFKACLAKLGIELKVYDNYKETLISRKENLTQLLTQRLMTGHPRKYSKFLNMMKRYSDISDKTRYFSGERHAWNKIPKEKEVRIVQLYKEGLMGTKDLANAVGVSTIKVNRVLKSHSLGRRVVKTSEDKRKEIADFAKRNPRLNLKKIAERFDVHESVAIRAYRKYYGKRKQK